MAQSRSDLAELTVAQLRELAREAGVKGYTRLKRDELLACLGATAPAAALAGEPAAAPVAELAAADAPVVELPSSPVAQEPAQVFPVEDSWAFPVSYGADKVVLLVRDPRWMFAYWDVSGPTWASIEHRGLNSPASGWRRVLRLHDVTGTSGEPTAATRLSDLELSDDARDWYFQAPWGAREYLVQYGYLGPDGEFFLVASSNVAGVPRPTPSDQTDESWGHLFEHEEAYRLSLAGRGLPAATGDDAPSSAQLTQRLEEFLAEGLSSSLFIATPATARA